MTALYPGGPRFPRLVGLSLRRLQFPFALLYWGRVRGDRMGGLTRSGLSRSRKLARAGLFLLAVLSLLYAIPPVGAQQRREREPNSAYAERRAKLASNIDGPIVLLGYTGKEVEAQTYVFAQEENFYYLTGHNEEEAALILLPPNGSKAKKDDLEGAREIFFLPPKDSRKEKWNGVRMSPGDPGIEARTGFAEVKPLPELRATVERLAKVYPNFYTILPYQRELGGYPHEKETVDWLRQAAPQVNIKDIRANITDLRMVKSPTEVVLIRQAVKLSDEAQMEAMKMMRRDCGSIRWRQRWWRRTQWAARRRRPTLRSLAQGQIRRRCTMTSLRGRLRMAMLWCSTLARSFQATLRILHARCQRTASSRRVNARFMRSCWRRRMPPLMR